MEDRASVDKKTVTVPQDKRDDDVNSLRISVLMSHVITVVSAEKAIVYVPRVLQEKIARLT